MIFIILFS